MISASHVVAAWGSITDRARGVSFTTVGLLVHTARHRHTLSLYLFTTRCPGNAPIMLPNPLRCIIKTKRTSGGGYPPYPMAYQGLTLATWMPIPVCFQVVRESPFAKSPAVKSCRTWPTVACTATEDSSAVSKPLFYHSTN